MITLGVQPLVTFFMGQSRMALESLAVLPVLTSFVFIFRSLGLSYQEVVIALLGENTENYKILRKFAVILSIGLVGVLLIIAFTPLAYIWFNDVSGLSIELTVFSIIPLKIMAIFPMLTVLISFQRALLVDARKTKYITFATIIRIQRDRNCSYRCPEDAFCCRGNWGYRSLRIRKDCGQYLPGKTCLKCYPEGGKRTGTG